jgi:hypothetical protein
LSGWRRRAATGERQGRRRDAEEKERRTEKVSPFFSRFLCASGQKLYLEVKPGAEVLDGLGLDDVFCVVGASANIVRTTPR